MVIECDTDKIDAGDELELDIKNGILKDVTKNIELEIMPLPDVMIKLLADGGLVEHIKKIEDIGNIVPQDEESTKRWLETIISLGTWAIDFALSYKNMPGYETGIIATLLGEPEKEFRYRDPAHSGERANKTYELLLDLSKKYGIDISRTQVYAGRTNISHGHKENDFSLYLDTSKGSR